MLSKSNTQHVIIAIGDHGIGAVKELASSINRTENTLIVWAGHKEFLGLIDIKNIVDYIALPQHVIDLMDIAPYQTAKAQLIPTIGVAHNVCQKELTQALQETTLDIPKSEYYIGVFLGGDAPDSENNMKYFTSEEAMVFASLVAKEAIARDATVLLTNGPRTGKHDPITGIENSLVHHSDYVDQTSNAFIETLEGSGVKYLFANFVFGSMSAYKPFLALVKQTEGIAFVTGESTSMVSEIGDNLQPGALFIMVVNSMNDTHHAHVKSYYDSGLVNLV